MGKSRKTNKSDESFQNNQTNDMYTTSTGAKIPMDGYDEEFFKKLETNIDFWIDHAGASPNFFMSSEEINYILTHMQSSEGDPNVPSGYLTRVEKARHFQKKNYKVGDTLKDEAIFRSYSKTQEGTLEYLQKNSDPDRAIVIYRTHGNVKHYDASKFDDKFKWEAESFVEQNKMKITSINELKGDSLSTLPKELGLDLDVNSLEKPLPYSITIVDVEQAN